MNAQEDFYDDVCEYCGSDMGAGGCADDMPNACDDCWAARHFEPYSDLMYDHPKQKEQFRQKITELKAMRITRLISMEIFGN